MEGELEGQSPRKNLFIALGVIASRTTKEFWGLQPQTPALKNKNKLDQTWYPKGVPTLDVWFRFANHRKGHAPAGMLPHPGGSFIVNYRSPFSPVRRDTQATCPSLLAFRRQLTR